MDGSLYEVFLSALDAYDPSADTLFTSYFSYPFKNMTAELLGYRTERGRREPLNNCDSLDRPISTDEGEDSTLGDFIQDPAAGFEDDVIEGLNREQEAKARKERTKQIFTIVVCVILVLALGIPTIGLAALGGGA